jgi:hypothetical protein
MIVTTPLEITIEIELFCSTVSMGQRPVFLDIQPAASAIPLECFDNVKKKVLQSGGAVQHGWRIWTWPDVMVEAEFHAVWKTSTGEFIDITPCDEQRILFLPDDTKTYTGTSISNVRKPISLDSDIQEFVSITQDIDNLVIKQKANPTAENYAFVQMMLAMLAPRQEYLADQIAKRYPFPDGRLHARVNPNSSTTKK